MIRTTLYCVLAVTSLVAAAPADARISVLGNRVIYPAEAKEVTIRFSNRGDTPTLAQIWVDDFDQDVGPDKSRSPFVAMPPLVRVGANKTQAVRIRYTGGALPEDRESVFWLNILDAPARDGAVDASDPHIQIAIRNRLKLFYRPTALKGLDAASAVPSLQWSIVPNGAGWALQVRNDSPFHVNAVRAELQVGGQSVEAKDVDIIAPKSVKKFVVPGLGARPASAEVTFKYISDHGAKLDHRAPLIVL
jgi:chaperone protein EcpD